MIRFLLFYLGGVLLPFPAFLLTARVAYETNLPCALQWMVSIGVGLAVLAFGIRGAVRIGAEP